MNNPLHDLRTSTDLISLKAALHSICSEYGSVRRLDVLPARLGDQRQALCFLRMDTAEHEAQIMRALEVSRFAEHLVIVVDLLPPALMASPQASAASHV